MSMHCTMACTSENGYSLVTKSAEVRPDNPARLDILRQTRSLQTKACSPSHPLSLTLNQPYWDRYGRQGPQQ
jgi:hypothetical protein